MANKPTVSTQFSPLQPSIDYGPQRLIDTLLGAAIVLVFGYFIWPKPVMVPFDARHDQVRTAIAA